ncbi:MAG: hypothetical protein AB202_02615 [Parcubacteria bacterium C7867-007]|nr:MAG: hypothetical protein AB202_02615 [Parcubacteria bacterium C7867-007]
MDSKANLKSYQHYADLYDRFTVERCRELEALSIREITDEELPEGITKERAGAIMKWACDMRVRFTAGERYLKREETIRDWMDRDRKKDELYESAEAPEDIRCLTCRNRMKPTCKDLWDLDDKERVLFMYDCPNQCMPRRAFFNDGEEWRTKPKLCVNCTEPVITTSEERPNGYATVNTCTECGHLQTDEHEWHKEEDVYDENFAKDRDRFCLTEEEGKKFQEEKWNLERLGKFNKEWEEKQERLKKRLDENPKGFHLEGAGYTCAICRTDTPEGDNWYDDHGIKCLVCQKAIDEGEIPATVASDKESWYSKYDLEDRFSLKGATLRTWLKEGIIKSRIVSHYGKGTHYELFLIEDNKEFLPPKELTKSQFGNEIINGEKRQRLYPWYRFVDPFEHLKDYGIIKHMRVVPEDEMREREEAKKKKEEERTKRWEEKRARRKLIKKAPRKRKKTNPPKEDV